MNRNITRGLALAAITCGFTILGATAANAIDIGGQGDGVVGTGISLGGSTDGGILDNLQVPATADVPVAVNGQDVTVLPSSGTNSLGDGVTATTGNTMIDLFGTGGLNSTNVLGVNDAPTTVVGAPIDASNTWFSVLGNEPNGIVVSPDLQSQPSASATDQAIDATLGAPVDVSCSSVSVASDYQSDCAGTPGGSGSSGGIGGDLLGGILGGGLLGGLLDSGALNGVLGGVLNDVLGTVLGGGSATADGSATASNLQVSALDGSTLGDNAPLGGDGVVIDPTNDSTDLGTGVGLGDNFSSTVGTPVDASKSWVSVFGNGQNGIVVVPDSTVTPSLTTLGLIDSNALAPIVIDCTTITVLSDYQRDCAAGSAGPTEPTAPVAPTAPVTPGGGDNGGTADNGGNGGTGDGGNATGNPCAVAGTTTATTLTADVNAAPDLGLLGGAAVAGALSALGLLALGRKFSIL